ncbi:MAG: hypothetical protein LUG95_07490 [Clostridiales bacterium]|nr:hypothetical protein [Clostridiales bacterium]
MNMSAMLDDFVELMRSDSYFDDVKIVRAYPFTIRLTMLKESIVAVGFSNIEIEPYSVGGNDGCGKVKLFADIYVPLDDMSKRTNEILTHICRAAESMNISSILAERIYADKETMSYVLKTEIEFYGDIVFGGGGGE